MSAKGSVLKRVRQSEKANEYNNHYKSMMKTSVKKILGTTTKEDAESLKSQAFKIIDRIASKGIIHKNKAANQKTKISKHLNNLK